MLCGLPYASCSIRSRPPLQYSLLVEEGTLLCAQDCQIWLPHHAGRNLSSRGRDCCHRLDTATEVSQGCTIVHGIHQRLPASHSGLPRGGWTHAQDDVERSRRNEL